MAYESQLFISDSTKTIRLLALNFYAVISKLENRNLELVI